jgi:hypothetical protein
MCGQMIESTASPSLQGTQLHENTYSSGTVTREGGPPTLQAPSRNACASSLVPLSPMKVAFRLSTCTAGPPTEPQISRDVCHVVMCTALMAEGLRPPLLFRRRPGCKSYTRSYCLQLAPLSSIPLFDPLHPSADLEAGAGAIAEGAGQEAGAPRAEHVRVQVEHLRGTTRQSVGGADPLLRLVDPGLFESSISMPSNGLWIERL